MPKRNFSDEEYRQEFTKDAEAPEKSVNLKALERALDIRKFEIELYWKRAAYFWIHCGHPRRVHGDSSIQCFDQD